MLLRFLFRRLAIGLVIVWVVSLLVFVAIHLLPGNAALSILGKNATPRTIASLNRQLGLDRSLADQYWRWLSGLVTGAWGTSLVSSLKVSSIVGTRALNTALIAFFATVVSVPIAALVGTLSATRSGGWMDSVVSVLTLVLAALPSFVIAILVIYVLATNVLHLFPAASLVDPSRSIFSQLKVTILPSLTLVLATVPYPIRMVRASVIDVLESDYVMNARLRGLSEPHIIFRHALRNAWGPMIQATALNLLFMAGGLVVVETVFAYPGIGYALVQAVGQRDVPVVQTITVLLAAAYVAVNLLADLGVILVTPRLRAQL
jgi:peptide/nickel transport system permease protein